MQHTLGGVKFHCPKASTCSLIGLDSQILSLEVTSGIASNEYSNKTPCDAITNNDSAILLLLCRCPKILPDCFVVARDGAKVTANLIGIISSQFDNFFVVLDLALLAKVTM